MICVVPDPVTWLLVTSMLSTTESSDVLQITILPLSASTTSEKFRTILLSSAIAIASSAGLELVNVGSTASPVVKDKDVVS